MGHLKSLSSYLKTLKYVLLSQEQQNNLEISLTWEGGINTIEADIREIRGTIFKMTSSFIVSRMK